MNIPKHRLSIFLAFLTSLFLILSFPKYDLSFFSWIALVPLLFIIQRMRWLKAFVLSWMVGLISFMGIFIWINQVKGYSAIYFLFSGLYLWIYFGLFGLFSRLFDYRRFFYPVLVALVWVILEYARSNLFFLSLPWALLGQTQYKNINLIQISAYTGVYGISFLVALVNSSIAVILSHLIFSGKLEKKGVGFFCYHLSPILLVLLISFWGRSVQKNNNISGSVRVGLVQGNIPQDIKWNKETFGWSFERYKALTKDLAEAHPSLIIWPETAMPLDFHSSPWYLWRILALAREIDVPIILGAAGAAKIEKSDDRSKGIYNSAFYISSQGKMSGEYQKIKLLPFGEYIPSIGKFSLSFLTPGLTGKFIAGSKEKIFPLNEKPFGVTICWEGIFADLFRRFVSKGASFMVNISNDAWFKDSAGPYQHFVCNIFRAVENRISIARVSNTGISCIIDPFGRVIKKVENKNGEHLNITGVVCDDMPLYQGATFYTKYGDIFVIFCITLFSLALVFKFTKYICFSRTRSKKVDKI
ncbi:MAG: apolipoprotein N-acyltransferase [bacterium]